MFQSDVDAAARETLRLIGSDPQNWVPERDGVETSPSSAAGNPEARLPLHCAVQESAGSR